MCDSMPSSWRIKCTTKYVRNEYDGTSVCLSACVCVCLFILHSLSQCIHNLFFSVANVASTNSRRFAHIKMCVEKNEFSVDTILYSCTPFACVRCNEQTNNRRVWMNLAGQIVCILFLTDDWWFSMKHIYLFTPLELVIVEEIYFTYLHICTFQIYHVHMFFLLSVSLPNVVL